MTDSEILDHVASAIRNAAFNRSGKGKLWKDLPEHVRVTWRNDARAAIQAYRETQPDMAGATHPGDV